MLHNHLHIVLVNPEIPQNTGNIARLACATACRLHIIRPCGFSMSERNLLRPGLDYWPFLDIEVHDSYEEFLQTGAYKPAFFTKKASRSLFDREVIYKEIDTLVFGCETKGLPDSLLKSASEDRLLRIPMFESGVRSLNLANSVAIGVYKLLDERGVI